MANLRCLIVLCSILYLSASSKDFSAGETDDCCSKCYCSNKSYRKKILISIYEIDCSNKSLTEVPNCPWENTTIVNFRDNKIQNISKETFRRFKNIQDLDFAKNELFSLPNPNVLMVGMEGLNLDGNKFKTVPTTVLSKMINLKFLHMAENHIHEVGDFWIQKKLQVLELSKNKIKKFPRFAPKMMPRMRKLSLCGNHLKEFPENAFENIQMLESLDLSNNTGLATIPFAGIRTLANLKRLCISNTNITIIPDLAFKDLNNLIELELSEPQSGVKHYIGNNSFAFLPSLAKLSLNNFNLGHFPNITGNFLLEDLRLSGNQIKVLPSNLCDMVPNLKDLDVNSNELQALPELHCEHLEAFRLSGNQFKVLPSNLCDMVPNLKDLYVNSNELEALPELHCEHLEDFYLNGNQIKVLPSNLCDMVPNLKDLYVNSNELEALPELHCEHLEALHVYKNKLKALPKLSGCKQLYTLIVDSNNIRSFGDSLNGLSSILDISAKNNVIESIEENDFKGLKKLQKLLLDENHISSIHKNAFSDLVKLKDLTLAYNNFPELPTLGLATVETLSIEGNSKLTKFPSPRHLPNIEFLRLYYPYHCCAFLKARKISPNTSVSNGDPVTSTWVWLSNDIENITTDLEDPDSSVYDFTSEPQTFTKDDEIEIKCTPEPDPFFPCEDLMGDWVLRCGVWIVFVLALCGNATVIIVILASHTKIDVSRFLISNLAFADLFMGIYLGFLAVVDVSTLGNFKSYGVEWQLGPGCRTAGFLATLSSELSVFTLTVITVERYIAIKNAIRVNRKLQLKTAVVVMIFGWVFALVTATLPLLEVNSYGKFSVCLPFETDDKKSLVFLVFLLCLNAAAFIVILFCYILMYCSIRGSNAWNASDFRVAKRMALLVFTDFACWAPIVFFSLTATFGSCIISLSQAKIFTVFVFPLNSCCNPFLYAIFTSHFKKDLLAICRRVEDKYPFLKITRQRMSFSRRSSYSGAVSENQNLYLRVRRFSLPVTVARGLNNSITTNGRGSDSSNSNKISSDTNPVDCNDILLTERVTSL